MAEDEVELDESPTKALPVSTLARLPQIEHLENKENNTIGVEKRESTKRFTIGIQAKTLVNTGCGSRHKARS